MPWPDRLSAALRRLYRVSGHVPEDMARPSLPIEQDLMARHARRWPAPAPGGLRAFARAHRWAVATGCGALVGVAACRMPLDYDRDFGASVRCEAADVAVFDGGPARGLADRLQAGTGATQVAVRIAAEDGARAALRIDLWGADAALVGRDLLAEVEAQAHLPAASCAVEPMVGTVHGTLGGRLGLELFDLELLDRDDAEAARRQILERLEARGLHGDATVEISDRADGRREIKIQIEAKGDHELEVKAPLP